MALDSLREFYRTLCISFMAAPNILFIFYSVQIVGRIVYSYSAE